MVIISLVDNLVVAGLAKKGELIKLVSGTAIEAKVTVNVHKVTGSVNRLLKQLVEVSSNPWLNRYH